MKKFIISLIVGITMMAIGTTMLVFEIKDYKFVEGAYHGREENQKTETFSVKNDKLTLVFVEKEHTSYHFVYDESLQDEVNITCSSHVEYRRREHEIYIDDIDHNDINVNDGFSVFHQFMEGLKKHEIYTFENYADVTITTAKKNRDRVDIYYE